MGVLASGTPCYGRGYCPVGQSGVASQLGVVVSSPSVSDPWLHGGPGPAQARALQTLSKALGPSLSSRPLRLPDGSRAFPWGSQ